MVSFESQDLEFKIKVDNFMEISKTACAFANAVGGKLLIGIRNDGTTIGISDHEIESLQQRVEGAIQRVSPIPLHNVRLETKDGKNIVVAEVFPLQNSLCTFGGITYYRQGSSNTKLEGKTFQDFLIRKRILVFDELASKATMDDIDAVKVKGFLSKRSPSVPFEEGKLRECLLNINAASADPYFYIRNAGVLFFAKDPSKFTPQNEIKLVKFKGLEAVSIVDSRILNSTITEGLFEAEKFIKNNTRLEFKIDKLQREEVPQYPPAVIREILVNAVTHRDYLSRDVIQINIFDDRIEFINPGLLPDGLTLKTLGSISVQRNPIIYSFMRSIGLVEGLVTGIPRVRSLLRNEHFPEPRFEELGGFFRVTIYNKTRIDLNELSDRQKGVLSYLEMNPSISSVVYAKMIDVSKPIAVKDLNDLIEKGFLKKIGKTRGAYYTLTKD